MAIVCKASDTWSTSLPDDRKLSLEQGHAGMQFVQEFPVRHPNEVLKADRHERFAVRDLQSQLDARGREIEAVGDIGEGASLAQ